MVWGLVRILGEGVNGEKARVKTRSGTRQGWAQRASVRVQVRQGLAAAGARQRGWGAGQGTNQAFGALSWVTWS